MEGIAPWIQAALPADYYQRSFGPAAEAALGQQRSQLQAVSIAAEAMASQQRIALAQAEMQQESERRDMEMELAKRKLQQEQMMQEHQMAIDAAYNFSRTRIDQQKLEEDRRMNDLKLSESIRMHVSGAQYGQDLQNIYESLVKSGMPEDKAIATATMRAALANPDYVQTTKPAMWSAVNTMMKQQAPMPEGPITLNPVMMGGQKVPNLGGYINPRTGSPTFTSTEAKGDLREESFLNDLDKSAIAEHQREIGAAMSDLRATKKPKEKEKIQATIDEAYQKIDAIRNNALRRMHGLPAEAGAPTAGPGGLKKDASGATIVPRDPKTGKLMRLIPGKAGMTATATEGGATIPESVKPAPKPMDAKEVEANINKWLTEDTGIKGGNANRKNTFLRTVADSLEKYVNIPDDDRRYGSSTILRSKSSIILEALLKGKSTGVTAKQIQALYDALSPEHKNAILEQAMQNTLGEW